MFRVERHDVTGNSYSSHDNFVEANEEYERQVHNAIGYEDDEAVVILSVTLRSETIAREKVDPHHFSGPSITTQRKQEA